MEAKNNMDDQLTRYLFKESGPEEISIVIRWINESKENRLYFEGLKKTVELVTEHDSIEKIDVAAEWNNLQEVISSGVSRETPLQEGIIAPSGTSSTHEDWRTWKKVYRLIIPAAVAASLIVLVLTQGLFHTSKVGVKPMPGKTSVAISNPDNAVMHHERNISGVVKSFALPDGSGVLLSNNSELTYSEPAGGHQRNVSLKGEAVFAVEKNKAKPFTVVSGDISTMAVGTRFTVTAFEHEKFIQVKLVEGKVLVKAEKPANNKQADQFYLLPGQKLIYDKNRQTAKIKSFRREEKYIARTDAGKDQLMNDNPLLPFNNNKSWFMFNNQPLNEIFHSLEYMYNVKIIYAKKDVDQRYFIGTFSKSDSVETILKQIAVLNKLTVTKKENTFTIEKNK